VERDKIILNFRWLKKSESFDLEVPLQITANELILGLIKGLDLPMNADDVSACYLKTENPIALLRGNRLLSEFGLRNGTVVNFTL